MDARSLLRAKKAEAKIDHPYASYNAAGVLRCSICAVPVKQWDAHLLTKQHRTSVAREKAEAAKAASAAKSKSSKRPAEDPVNGGASDGKRARVEASSRGGPSGLPEGFFSAGNQPVVAPDSDDDEDNDQGDGRDGEAGPSTAASASVAAPTPIAPTGDADLDDFFASLEDQDPAPASAAPTNYSLLPASSASASTGKRKTGYKDLIPGQASYEAAPVRNVPIGEEEAGEVEPEETEAEKRERLAREEKEEIIGRLEEEERAQEDADSRVAFLKQRMEALRKKREGRSAPVKNGNKAASAQSNGS